MKSSIKYGVLALAISLSAASCSGDRSGQHNDSLKADTSAMMDSSHKTSTPAGLNGSAMSADTGLDHSGSGGTGTVKTP